MFCISTFFFTSQPLLLFFTLGYYFGRFNTICSLSFLKDMNVKKKKKTIVLYFQNLTFLFYISLSLLIMVVHFSKFKKKKTYQIYKDSKETVYSFQNVLVNLLKDYNVLSALGSTDGNFMLFSILFLYYFII